MSLQLGINIKRLREQRGLSQDDLGELLGVSGKTISSWEIGRTEPNMGKVEELSNVLNVQISDLILSSDSLEKVGMIFDDYFPLDYCSNLSAGTLEELLEADPDARVYVPIKFQMKKDRLHAFKVNGTSMNNVIPDGSIVITEDVTHLSKIKDGTIVVAWKEGEATVKRLYVSDHSITLMPDSTDKSHQPIVISTDDSQVKIIGRVIWFMNPDDIEKYF